MVLPSAARVVRSKAAEPRIESSSGTVAGFLTEGELIVPSAATPAIPVRGPPSRIPKTSGEGGSGLALGQPDAIGSRDIALLVDGSGGIASG